MSTEPGDLLTLLCLMMVLASALIDSWKQQIPNRLLLVFMLVGTGLTVYGSSLAGLSEAFIRAAAVLLVFFPFFVLRAIGAGDIKLFMLLAAFLGTETAQMTVTFSLLAGGVAGLYQMLRVRAVGFFSSRSGRFPTRPVNPGYMPYGVPIAIGTFIACLLSGRIEALLRFLLESWSG